MDLSMMDQETSREVYLGEDNPEQLHPSYHRDGCQDSLNSYSNGSIITQLLQRTIQNQRALKDSLFFSTPPAVSSSCMADHLEDRRSSSSKESGGGPSSPDSQPSTAASPEGEQPLNEHQRAKRARVENIIRGMAGSPSAWPPRDWEKSDGYVREPQEGRREKRRQQAAAEPQERRPRGSRDEEYQSLRQQLQAMQALLGKLQEKFIQVHGLSQSVHEVGEGKGPTGLAECRADGLQDKGRAERPERKLPVDPDSEFERRMNRVKVGRRKPAQTDSVRLTLDYEDRSLPETLKDELSKAVSQSVDLVFQNFSPASFNRPPQLHLGLKDRTEDRNAVPGARGLPVAADTVRSWPMACYKTAEAQPNGGDQTEALSLVIRKPPPCQAVQVETLRKPCQVRPYPFPLGHGKALQEHQILEQLLKYGPQEDYGSLPGIPLPGDRSGPDLVDFPWHSVKVRSKVKPSGDAEPAATASHAVVLGQVAMDSLCFPHVKMERGNLQSMVERSPYMSLNIQEGLTPNHLKKAKLMFFFTRYPSSNALKTFFPDVKFNRCVTSQLIKWFSNFREFYYIQVEKFARQAIMDGVANAKDLSVTRDSELFRALNMHYNKANDFQVPDRFLDVAETTLREFFNAILLAKDSDPSWKKAIYKVICKLDSDVPDDFKSFACS